MGGNDRFVEADYPVVGEGSPGRESLHLGVFIDPQISGQGAQKLQRMEPALALQGQRPRHRKGQRRLLPQLYPHSQLVQCLQLPQKLVPP